MAHAKSLTKIKISPRRHGDTEKTSEREKALPQITQMTQIRKDRGSGKKTFETQMKGGSGGARMRAGIAVIGKVISHSGGARMRAGIAVIGKGNISQRRRRDAEKPRSLMIGKKQNLRLFSVTPWLRGEDWVPRIQQLASK
jgi:hypothetical protein